FPPPVVPLPDQAWVAREGFRRGEVFRLEVPPETVGSAERGDPAIGGDAGAGEHGDRTGRSQTRFHFTDFRIVGRHAGIIRHFFGPKRTCYSGRGDRLPVLGRYSPVGCSRACC